MLCFFFLPRPPPFPFPLVLCFFFLPRPPPFPFPLALCFFFLPTPPPFPLPFPFPLLLLPPPLPCWPFPFLLIFGTFFLLFLFLCLQFFSLPTIWALLCSLKSFISRTPYFPDQFPDPSHSSPPSIHQTRHYLPVLCILCLPLRLHPCLSLPSLSKVSTPGHTSSHITEKSILYIFLQSFHIRCNR